MPPEPLPWVRKDFFKERKHERSESSSLGSTPRWRDSPSSHYGPTRDFPRYGGSCEPCRPSGYSKHGGWNPFSKDPGHVYMPFRSTDKMQEAENGRTLVSGADGKYSTIGREIRETLSQRDWKGHLWEVSNEHAVTQGRLHAMNSVQRSEYDAVTNSSSHLTNSEFENTWDEVHKKEQHDNNKISGVDGLGSGPKGDGENSLDWKPLRWSRCGSISSRGSGLSQSISSKSLGGVDSGTLKAELQPKETTPVNSPTGIASVTSAAAMPEDNSSRKKPRLGWGEGLAKYEKKKVDVSDGSVHEDGVLNSSTTVEPMYSPSSNLADKSPRIAGFSDSASPATPSSVAYSSSPAIEEKLFHKHLTVDNDFSNLCGSPSIGSQSLGEDLEKLDVSSLGALCSSLLELLYSDDPGSTDLDFARTAMNKLLIWKGDILKALETTETEIDSLDNELRALGFESGSGSISLGASGSFPSEDGPKAINEQKTSSDHIPQPSPLQVASCGNEILEVPYCCETMEEHVKYDDIDCSDTVASRFLEPLSLSKSASLSGCSAGVNEIQCTPMEIDCLVSRTSDDEETLSLSEDINLLAECKDSAFCHSNTWLQKHGEDNLCDLILASNKKSAARASDVFNKLLCSVESGIGLSQLGNGSSWQNNTLLIERFTIRRRYLRFKEKALIIKFRAFHRLWKEDLRIQAIRRHRAKSQKKLELNLRPTQTGHQKHRSSLRLRFSSHSGNFGSVPTTEVLNFASKLLSEPQLSNHRDDLRMPAVILDTKQKASRFSSSNGLVEDPCAVEKERALINPWTSEEREIFIDKLATVGKDFRKIASFLDHKTTADCVEFYYKNHKSDCFAKTKQSKCAKSSNNYMVATGKKWNYEANPASLDILSATSTMGVNAERNMMSQKMQDYQIVFDGYRDSRISHCDDESLARDRDSDFLGNEREKEAANALVGFCGSISSEAVGSCVTGSVDPGEAYRKKARQKYGSTIKMTFTSSPSHDINEDTCAEDICEEVDHTDWNDDEKSLFIQAVSAYGKDFATIARYIRTRTRDQCKVFFSKARKCLGLDSIHPSGNLGTSTSDNATGGGSDTEGACAVEIGSVICSDDKLSSKIDVEFLSHVKDPKQEESNVMERVHLLTDLNGSEESNSGSDYDQDDAGVVRTLVSDSCKIDQPVLDVNVDVTSVNGHVDQLKPLHDQSTAFEPGKEETGGEEEDLSIDGSRQEVDCIMPNPDMLVAEEVANGVTSDGTQPLSRIVSSCQKNSIIEVANGVTSDGTPLLPQIVSSCQTNSNIEETLPLDTGSCSNINVGVENREVSSDLRSEEKAPVGLLQETNLTLLNTGLQDYSHGRGPVMHLDLQPTGFLETLDTQSRKSFGSSDYCHMSGNPLGKQNNSSQMFGCCPLPITAKKKMNGYVSCGSLSEVQSLLSSERVVNGQSVSEDHYLQNVISSKTQHLVPGLSDIMSEHKGLTSGHSRSLSDTERPCRNGDFKLFGTVLGSSSSLQKSNSSCTHENDEKGVDSKPSCTSSTLRVPGTYNIDGDAGLLKFDQNGHRGLENITIRSYGFWDGNRIQTGFPSVPLAKYPATFTNYSESSSKTVQQGLHSFKSNDRHANGICGFPIREVSGCNGVVDFQMHRSQEVKPQPFAVELKSLEMNRRNGCEAISTLHPQQGRVLNTVGGTNIGSSYKDSLCPK